MVGLEQRLEQHEHLDVETFLAEAISAPIFEAVSAVISDPSTNRNTFDNSASFCTSLRFCDKMSDDIVCTPNVLLMNCEDLSVLRFLSLPLKTKGI